jgi:hypothetical protein
MCPIGIMMSSHNVSSLHEIEAAVTRNRLTKSVNNRPFINVNSDQLDVSVDSSILNNMNNLVDLSLLSRDQMVAGPSELFNKNDAKLAIEMKQKQLE